MNLTIKNMPARLHQKLKAQAEENNRSLNGEVVDILEKSMGSFPLDIEELLDEVRRMRSSVHGPLLTDEFLQAAKNEGRP